jgi:hypothetical protein
MKRMNLISFLTVAWSTAAVAGTVEPKSLDSAGLAPAIRQARPGDTVRLPSGMFELSEPVRPRSGIKLLGAGQDQTRLVFKANRPGVLVSLDGCEDVELAHVTLDGENNPMVHQGIAGGNARRLWLHHLTICNLKAKTWGPHAILFSGRNPTMEGGVTDSRITDCQIENIGRPRSRAEGDSRSAANKVRQHESRFSRHRARGNPGARVGVIDRSHLGPISFGVVGPKRARPLQGQAS